VSGSRSRYGLAVSALGAVVLAVAVFLPWYGVSFTSSGVALAQRVGQQIVARYGNAALQSQIASLHLSGLAGHELGSLSAHQALSTINVVLLVLAGLVCAVAVLALAGPASAASDANRLPLAVLGLLAAVLVLFRIVDVPTPAGDFLSLSVREGAWLALLAAVAIVAGALWPSRAAGDDMSPLASDAVWAQLSGWTPKA
jgi:hypothetical protein